MVIRYLSVRPEGLNEIIAPICHMPLDKIHHIRDDTLVR
jgi:hypothetical protein